MQIRWKWLLKFYWWVSVRRGINPDMSGRRKTRAIESNAKFRYLKKLTCNGTLRQVFIFLRLSPYLGFCLEENQFCRFWIWSEKRVVNSCRKWTSTQLNTPPPPHPHPATICRYILYFFVGKGGGGAGEKRRGAIAHKTGSKIPTWLTVSPVYKLYKTPVNTTNSFGVFIVN